MQVMRVFNFYNFNNPDNTLDRIYYCGGRTCYSGLMSELQNNLELPLVDFTDLLNEAQLDRDMINRIPAAIGVTMEA